jgi:hypothetical protein
LGQELAILLRQIGLLQKIGTAFCGATQGLFTPPAGDGGVIAGE